MTNADRFRQMSDEKLAATITCPNEMGMADIDCDPNNDCDCYKCCLEWLKAEEKEPTGGNRTGSGT